MDQGTQHTLTVTSHDDGGITFVKMRGSLSSTTAERGDEEMKKILDKGAKKVVINLADLDYISSGGIRVLLVTSKSLNSVQGEMKISGAKGMVKEALETSGFGLLKRAYGSTIELFDTDEAARTGFKS
jgi:anti-anti-sigma factor